MPLAPRAWAATDKASDAARVMCERASYASYGEQFRLRSVLFHFDQEFVEK